jgi:hypothetical protein
MSRECFACNRYVKKSIDMPDEQAYGWERTPYGLRCRRRLYDASEAHGSGK